jgi:hypothetical protein
MIIVPAGTPTTARIAWVVSYVFYLLEYMKMYIIGKIPNVFKIAMQMNHAS